MTNLILIVNKRSFLGKTMIFNPGRRKDPAA